MDAFSSSASTMPALAHAVAAHYGFIVMKPCDVFIIQVLSPQQLREVVLGASVHRVAADVITALWRENGFQHRRDEYAAAVETALDYPLTSACPQGRATSDNDSRNYWVRSGMNYFSYYEDVNTAIARAYPHWTPAVHLQHMPRRVQRVVKTFLCVLQRLGAPMLGRDLRARIVRTYVYADWLFMKHEYATRDMTPQDVKMAWEGGKKVPLARMQLEIAQQRSTHELMQSHFSIGDTDMAARRQATPTERFRVAWTLRRYGECMSAMGLGATTAPIGGSLPHLIAAIVHTRAWQEFYNMCDTRTISIADVADEFDVFMFVNHDDDTYNMGPRILLPLFWPLYDWIVRVSAVQHAWGRVDHITHVVNDITCIHMALQRGYGWCRSLTLRTGVEWRAQWVYWTPARHAVPYAYTLEFRVQVRIIYQLARHYGTDLCATMARCLALAHYVAETHPALSTLSKKSCMDYASRWRMPGIKASMGSLEMQRAVGEHMRVVALMRMK